MVKNDNLYSNIKSKITMIENDNALCKPYRFLYLSFVIVITT